LVNSSKYYRIGPNLRNYRKKQQINNNISWTDSFKIEKFDKFDNRFGASLRLADDRPEL